MLHRNDTDRVGLKRGACANRSHIHDRNTKGGGFRAPLWLGPAMLGEWVDGLASTLHRHQSQSYGFDTHFASGLSTPIFLVVQRQRIQTDHQRLTHRRTPLAQPRHKFMERYAAHHHIPHHHTGDQRQ